MKKKRLGFSLALIYEEEELGIHEEEEELRIQCVIMKKRILAFVKKKRLGFSLALIYEEEELGIHEEEEELRIQCVIMRLHLPLLSSG